jgi:hypothetical protein
MKYLHAPNDRWQADQDSPAANPYARQAPGNIARQRTGIYGEWAQVTSRNPVLEP